MPRRSAIPITTGIFAFLVTLYVASPVRTPYDSRWSIHTAMSLIEGQGGDLGDYQPALEANDFYFIEYPGGRPRTAAPIGVSLLAAPAVAVVALVDPSFKDMLRAHVPANLEKVLASIFGAAAAAIFFQLIFDRFRSLPIALAATLIFALGTSMWSTATRALWQHGPLILMLVIAMWLLQRAQSRPALVQFVGLPLAMGYVIRPTAAIPIVAISAYVLLYRRAWFTRYAVLMLLIAVPWLAFNYAIYGAALPPYYRPDRLFNWSSFLDALAGHLISPARGIFIYSPVLLFAFSGFLFAWRDPLQRPLHVTYGVIVVAHYLLISLTPDWWGGHSFGPRYVSDIIPFLAYFTACSLRRPAEYGRLARTAVFAGMGFLGVASIAIHAQGALRTSPMGWNITPKDVSQDRSRLWDWSDPPFLRTPAATPER